MAEEASKREADVGPTLRENFHEWVGAFMAAHFDNPHSRRRYGYAWARVSDFLRREGIRHPAEVRYAHAARYMAWRMSEGGLCNANTARLELKLWSFVMAEAMRREFCPANPLALAHVPRRPPKAKRELSAEDFAAARRAFAARKAAPWMLTVFETCAHLGCRFAEADLGREDVDFEAGLVWLTDAKRQDTDPRKRFAVPLPPALASILKAALEARPRTSPRLTGEQNRQFNKTLKAACGATSHSLRVSFITRCHRAGLSEAYAMRLVNHSTRLVHALYTKLGAADVKGASARVPSP